LNRKKQNLCRVFAYPYDVLPKSVASYSYNEIERHLKLLIMNKKNLTENMGELQNENTLSLSEELNLIERVKQGDKEAEEMLGKVNVRLVSGVAKKYQNKGVSEEDLLKAGKEGLIKAAHKYDASCGFKFMSYAVWWIRQSILAAVGEKTEIENRK
jgi:RNA polymerase primary sigma factor